jgi:hypothetical protein
VVDGCEGAVEVEVEVPASPLPGVGLSPGTDVEETCPDSVATIAHAPLSGGATAAIVPAKRSARRRNLLTGGILLAGAATRQALPPSWVSRVSGPWLLA